MRALAIKTSKAFTLVEILCACAIVSILSIIVLSLARESTCFWSKSTSRLSERREVVVAFEFLEEDFNSLYSIDDKSCPVIWSKNIINQENADSFYLTLWRGDRCVKVLYQLFYGTFVPGVESMWAFCRKECNLLGEPMGEEKYEGIIASGICGLEIIPFYDQSISQEEPPEELNPVAVEVKLTTKRTKKGSLFDLKTREPKSYSRKFIVRST